MTVPSSTSRNDYIGTGSVATYSFGFRIFAATDLELKIQDAIGSETTLTYGVDYTVGGVGSYNGGTITLTAGNLASGYRLAIRRVLPITQTTALQNQGAFFAKSHEDAFDRFTMVDQQLKEQLDRSFRLRATDSAGIRFELPAPVANKMLAWDELGIGFKNIDPGSVTLAVPATGSVDQAKLALDVQYRVDTIAGLRALTNKYACVLVLGYNSVGDGGGGLFRWNSADTTADNAGTIIIPNAGGTGRWNRIYDSTINVRWFGARGTVTFDDTTAIQNAASALPSGAVMGTLYFPAGHYRITAGITIFNKGCKIRGEGGQITQLRVNADFTGAVFDLDTNGSSGCAFDIESIGIVEYGVNVDTAMGFRVKNSSGLRVRNCYGAIGGTMLYVDSCPVLSVSENNFLSKGSTCVFFKLCSGSVSDNLFHITTDATWGSGGRFENGVCMKLVGTTTSMQFSNNIFIGGGVETANKFTVTSIASNASTITVTTSAAHTFVPMAPVLIEGSSVAAYNALWKVDTCPTSTTFTITSTLNPGAATGGKAMRPRACVLVSGETGPVNECSWNNNLFSGHSTCREVGAISLHFEGLYAIQANTINYHNISNCFYDYGQIALWIQGKQWSTGNHDYTVAGINVSGGTMQYAIHGVYIAGAKAVALCNILSTCDYFLAPTSNQPDTSGVRLDAAGTSADLIDGINISSCHFGREWAWQDSVDGQYNPRYGLWIDGINVKNCIIVGNHFYGQTDAIRTTNNAAGSGATGTGWRGIVRDNFYGVGPVPLTGADIVPSVASGTTIALPWNEVIDITGTTTIVTMNNAWLGRQVMLVTLSAVTFNTGGNISNALTTVAGQLVTAVFDGSWHLK